MTDIIFHPFPDQIILEEIEINEKTASGIVLPSSTKTGATAGSLTAKVVYVGEDVKLVKEGDLIATHKGKCKQFSFINKMVFTCKEEDLIAWIEVKEIPDKKIIEPKQGIIN